MYISLYEKLKNKENIPENLKNDFEKFLKTINKFSYFEERHFEKVKIFSENEKLIEYLLFLIEDANPFFETNQDFKYILLILAYSKNENSIKYLENLTDVFIEKKARWNLLLQIFSFVKNEKLEKSLEKLKKFFEKLYEESYYFDFVERAWIKFSPNFFKKTWWEWYFSFALTTINWKEYEFQCNEEEKKNFYKIEISFFTPTWTEKCFKIKLSEPFYNISFYDWDKDYIGSEKNFMELYFKNSWKNFVIENWEKPEFLIETIKKIEEIIWVKFSLEKIYSSFPRWIQWKGNLEKWILENLG